MIIFLYAKIEFLIPFTNIIAKMNTAIQKINVKLSNIEERLKILDSEEKRTPKKYDIEEKLNMIKNEKELLSKTRGELMAELEQIMEEKEEMSKWFS